MSRVVLGEWLEIADAATPRYDRSAESLEIARLRARVHEQEEELRRARLRAVEAVDRERRRIERDLHDGAQQRLISAALRLNMLRTRLEAEVAESIGEVVDQLMSSVGELRALTEGIRPPALERDGLAGALAELVNHSAVPVRIVAIPARRLPAQLESAVYFIVAEALTNVAKHARASEAVVSVEIKGRVVVVEVRDDGIGGADRTRGTGLRGLAERVEAFAGYIDTVDVVGGGTLLRAVMSIDAIGDAAATALTR